MGGEANRVLLSAHLATCDVLRYSPAGVAILNCRLQHRSQQMEAVALGTVALSLAKVAPQAELEIEGFLARKYRTGPALEMHITNFELKD